MSSEGSYIVRPGDTLGIIARRNGTTAEKLAKINNIKNPNVIRVGQVINLSENSTQENDVAEKQLKTNSTAEKSNSSIQLVIVDRLLESIPSLPYQIVLNYGKKIIAGSTTANGLTSELKGSAGDTIEFLVQRVGGGFKKIYQTQLENTRKVVTAYSPSLKFEVCTKPHQGNPGQDVKKAERNKEGHPIIVIEKKSVELDFLDNYVGGELSKSDIEAAAKELKCEAGLVYAIAKQESSASSFTTLEGIKVPSILYERHWFRKLTRPSKKKPSPHEATHPNICGPAYKRTKLVKGKLYDRKTNKEVSVTDAYGATGLNQYRRLLIAYSLDQNAALQACSWGKFQIMGFNFKSAGFSSVKEFTRAMSISDAEHMKAFLKFAKSNKILLKGLQEKNFEKIAEGHNGSGWRSLNPDYASNIESFYNEYSKKNS